MTSAHPRVTIQADKRDAKPCIRGMRITVPDVLGWLAHGMTEEEILEEHPALEKEFRRSLRIRGGDGRRNVWPRLTNAHSAGSESVSQADPCVG